MSKPLVPLPRQPAATPKQRGVEATPRRLLVTMRYRGGRSKATLSAEEARKSWDHVLSDKVVYRRDAIEVTGDPVAHITESYVKGNYWIECHLIFEIQRASYHMLVVIEDQESSQSARELGKVNIE